MPIRDEDLQYLLKLDFDTSPALEAIKELGDEVDKLAATISKETEITLKVKIDEDFFLSQMEEIQNKVQSKIKTNINFMEGDKSGSPLNLSIEDRLTPVDWGSNYPHYVQPVEIINPLPLPVIIDGSQMDDWQRMAAQEEVSSVLPFPKTPPGDEAWNVDQLDNYGSSAIPTPTINVESPQTMQGQEGWLESPLEETPRRIGQNPEFEEYALNYLEGWKPPGSLDDVFHKLVQDHFNNLFVEIPDELKVRPPDSIDAITDSQGNINIGPDDVATVDIPTPNSRRASGGPLDGWTLVGEQGQELVSPSGYVFDADTTREMMNSGVEPEKKRAMGGGLAGLARDTETAMTGGGTRNLAVNVADMAGAASGIPFLGEIVEAVLDVASAVGELAAMPFRSIEKGFEGISKGLKDLQGNLGPIGLAFSVFEGIGSTLKGMVEGISPILGELLGPMIESITAWAGPAKEILGSLVNMSQMASPAVFQRWQIALEDVQGVIGRAFLPVLEMMREGVRLFGDVLATILPNFGEMQNALQPLVDAWGEVQRAIRSFFDEFGPALRSGLLTAINVVSRAIQGLVSYFMMMARIFYTVYTYITPFITGMQALAALFSSETGMRSSVGAAARSAQITSLEQYQQQLQISAFMEPPQASPEQRSAGFLEEIRNYTREIVRVLTNSGTTAGASVNIGATGTSAALLLAQAAYDFFADRWGTGSSQRGW